MMYAHGKVGNSGFVLEGQELNIISNDTCSILIIR